MIYIFTGARDSGKTSKMKAQYKIMPENTRGDGIVSRKIMQKGECTGYDFVHLDGEMSVPGLRLKTQIKDNMEAAYSIGKFCMLKNGFRFAESVLRQCIADCSSPVWFDEIGKLELEDGGFAGLLLQAVKKCGTIYMTCRNDFLKDIIQVFSLREYQAIACLDQNRTG